MNLMKSDNISLLVEEIETSKEVDDKTGEMASNIKNDVDSVNTIQDLMSLRNKDFYKQYLSDNSVNGVLRKLGEFTFSREIPLRAAIIIVFAINYILEPEVKYTLADIFKGAKKKTFDTNLGQNDNDTTAMITFDSVNLDAFFKFKSAWFDMINRCKEIFSTNDIEYFNKEYLEKILPKALVINTLFY